MNRMAVVVLIAACLMGMAVYWRTGDPVRGMGVVYIAGLLVFALHEGHKAWRSDRRRWTRVRYTGPERRT